MINDAVNESMKIVFKKRLPFDVSSRKGDVHSRWRKIRYGSPKKSFQCSIKNFPNVACLVVPYLNLGFFFLTMGTFLWDAGTFFGTPDYMEEPRW